MRTAISTLTFVGWRSKVALATMAVIAVLLLAFPIMGHTVRPTNAVLVYLMLTLLIAATFGMRASLFVALVSDVILVFFFFEPVFVFWIHDFQLRITLVVFIVLAVTAAAIFQEMRSSLVPRDSLRAAAGANSAGSAALRGPLLIDLENRRVLLNGSEVLLTPTEYSLLSFLFVNAGKVLNHRTIIANVWGEQYGEDSQILRTYIKQLRYKLGDDPAAPRFIRTEARLGYRFIGESG